jgi:hypothetical protein
MRIKVIEQQLKSEFILEITIARKVLPHPQGIKGSTRKLMNKRLFSLYDPALPGRDVWRDDFDVLK